jgi:hypothetical protein
MSECELEEQANAGSWFFELPPETPVDLSGRLCAEGFASPNTVRSVMPRSGFSARLLLASVMLSSVAYGERQRPIPAGVKMHVFGAVD